ncbi:hypothetical protein SAMN05216241_105111 [Limimonas halophila]|uniref:Uncharacterized protein n=1 Tax=Limimonas halophila TaxID=1082479 RepID=A0A1G7RFN2_9PROT|nr:hypothetical protein [Limimonas halophila]SDG09454.1 hypothetical protein SAMN05216241_105111 [Limimonas halophila]
MQEEAGVNATVTLMDDAGWNEERGCVELTAMVRDDRGSRQLPVAVSAEALERKVRTPSRPDPLRLVRDFDREIAQAVERRLAGNPPEVVLTARDL